ncbi:23629_t:CDS:1, partial [Cetraspora pellucida]
LSTNELEIIKKPNNRKNAGRKPANNDDKLAQENKKAYNNRVAQRVYQTNKQKKINELEIKVKEYKDFNERLMMDYNTLKESNERLKESHENIEKEYNLLKQINSNEECRIEIMEDVEENSITDVQNNVYHNKISSIEVNDGNIDLGITKINGNFRVFFR